MFIFFPRLRVTSALLHSAMFIIRFSASQRIFGRERNITRALMTSKWCTAQKSETMTIGKNSTLNYDQNLRVLHLDSLKLWFPPTKLTCIYALTLILSFLDNKSFEARRAYIRTLYILYHSVYMLCYFGVRNAEVIIWAKSEIIAYLVYFFNGF